WKSANLEGTIQHRLVATVGLETAENRQAGVFADHTSRAIAQRDADRTRMESVPVERPHVGAVQEANADTGEVGEMESPVESASFEDLEGTVRASPASTPVETEAEVGLLSRSQLLRAADPVIRPAGQLGEDDRRRGAVGDLVERNVELEDVDHA